MAPRPPSTRQPVATSASTALVLVDQRPLQRETWTEFHRAQKLQEKSARDLHRHENTDTPAYERWLHTTFPNQITALRELHVRVSTLSREVDQVSFMASLTGRSPKKLWRERKEYLADPEAFERKAAAAEAKARAARPDAFPEDDTDDDDDFFENLFGDAPDSSSDPDAARSAGFPPFHPPARPAPDTEARDIYRRLVQHLHPDRGGEWTPARQRLWHEVQQAWANRDTDWLARLEIEWETAHDVINENSSIDRLRRAIEELRSARRDTERKLRAYRQTPAWRFTLAEKKRPHLHRRLASDLLHDLDVLQRQHAYLQETIAAWESTPSPRRPKPRPRRSPS